MTSENDLSQNPEVQTPTPPMISQQAPKKKGIVLFVVPLAVLIILVAGAAWFFWGNKSPHNPSTQESSETNLPTQHREGQAPDSIIAKTDALIVAKVGQDFFRKYIKFISGDVMCFAIKGHSCSGPSKSEPYMMRYALSIPEKSVSATINFFVDENGELAQPQPIQLPACVNRTERCVVNVDRQQVLDIATEKGIEKDSNGNYETTFSWSEGDQAFVWSVRGRLTNSAHPCGKDETIIINANTGQILHQSTTEAACTNSTSVTQ